MGQISSSARSNRKGTKSAKNRKEITGSISSFVSLRALCSFAVVFSSLSCKPAPKSQPDSSATHPTVASLVPAATDLIVQMGLSNHLVGISNYDDATDLHLNNLPRVGDYQNVDWERLSQIRPDILIIFESPGRIPAGLLEHANAIHTSLVNIQTETMQDIVVQSMNIGSLLHEQSKAKSALDDFSRRIQTVYLRTTKLKKIRTLLLIDPATLGVVGTHNFLNDALEIAGGQNVISAVGWPSIDREMLLSLHPEVIIALLAEESPQSLASARKFLDAQISPSCRTAIIAHWYAQQSSFSVAEIAEELADILHPKAATTAPSEGQR